MPSFRDREVLGWCLYDWANSAFATTVMAALLPPYFSNVAATALPKAQASSIWGYATSITMLVVAFLGRRLSSLPCKSGRDRTVFERIAQLER